MNQIMCETRARYPVKIGNENKLESAIYPVALTIYAEGFGYGLKELEAIANVIKNRKNRAPNQGWSQVCFEPHVFPQFLTLVNHPDATDSFFQMCLRIARRTVWGCLTDTTNGATRFHHCLSLPFWARGKTGIPLEDFIFYQD